MKNTLYNFRRCPFAIRARLALKVASIDIEIIEVSLKNKPAKMLALSPKGTVPVLHLQNGIVIDESLDIMRWALSQNDPEHWLHDDNTYDYLLEQTQILNRYIRQLKFISRTPEISLEKAENDLRPFIDQYENALIENIYLTGSKPTMIDYAIVPFIRQLAIHDESWCQKQGMIKTLSWYKKLCNSSLFQCIMQKH